MGVTCKEDDRKLKLADNAYLQALYELMACRRRLVIAIGLWLLVSSTHELHEM